MADFDPIESFAAMRHEFGEHGGVNMSIEASTTFTVMDAATMPEIFQGRKGPEHPGGGCFLYGRHFNPTVYVLGKQVAALEGAEAGYCTASGMAAVAAAILQLCGHGDHAVAGHTIYGGTFALLSEFLPVKTGIRTRFVDLTDLESVETAFTPLTRVLYAETISNPTLRVADLAKLAHRHDARAIAFRRTSPRVRELPGAWTSSSSRSWATRRRSRSGCLPATTRRKVPTRCWSSTTASPGWTRA